MIHISCDFCTDEQEKTSSAGVDYFNVKIGKPDIVVKQICRKCVSSIQEAIVGQR